MNMASTAPDCAESKQTVGGDEEDLEEMRTIWEIGIPSPKIAPCLSMLGDDTANTEGTVSIAATGSAKAGIRLLDQC